MTLSRQSPAHGDYAIRPYRSDDERGVLQLLAACFQGWPGKSLFVDPAAHLSWKMRSSPDLEAQHVVAELDGEIVGFRLGMNRPARVLGQTLLLHQGADSAVHPDHQGRGLMAGIKEHETALSIRAFDLQLMGQSAHPAMSNMRARSGYVTFANRTEILRYRPDRHVDTAAPPLANVLFDERVDELWRTAFPEFDFAIARTSDYLNWRYVDHRAGAFSVVTVEDAGRLAGYAILCSRGDKGYIADVLVRPGRDDTLHSLLNNAKEHFANEGIRVVDCWTSERHPYRAALIASGFAHQKTYKEFGFLPLRTPLELLTRLAEKDAIIHLTAGDVDWI